MKKFNQKVAAITGAGSGIGRQIALSLAEQGCHLSLSDINTEGLAETVALVNKNNKHNVRVTSESLDVSDQSAVRQWATNTVEQHGKVNLIFNNAGVALGSTVEGESYEEIKWVMDINFWGVVYGTKEFLPHLIASGEGHIINVSSLFGLMAQPSQSAYNASKFAVRGFTESLRQELDLQKNGVSATCIHPGGIRTNIALSAKMNSSLDSIGINSGNANESFNKVLRIPANEAAKVILNAVKSNKRRALIGNDAKLLDGAQRLLPARYQHLMMFGTKHLQKFL